MRSKKEVLKENRNPAISLTLSLLYDLLTQSTHGP